LSRLFLDTNVILDLLAQANCSVIITRNAKDFKHSSIPVMTAEEYLKDSRRLSTERSLQTFKIFFAVNNSPIYRIFAVNNCYIYRIFAVNNCYICRIDPKNDG